MTTAAVSSRALEAPSITPLYLVHCDRVMSSTIAIPTTRSSAGARGQSPKTCGSSSSSFSSSPQTPVSANSETPESPYKRKAMHHRRPSLLSTFDSFLFLLLGVCPARALPSRGLSGFMLTCLLGSALSKEECTHVNVGDPDGPPRLVREFHAARPSHPANYRLSV